MRQRLLKRLEEVKLSWTEARGLVDRMKNGAFSEVDRQRVLEVLAAEQEVFERLEAWRPPVAHTTQRQAKRKRQRMKDSRRRNRRSGGEKRA